MITVKEPNYRRKISRRFLHEGRQTEILFFIGDKVYTGVLADVSTKGLGILIHEKNVFAQPGDEITGLYIGKSEKEYLVKGLKVAYVIETMDNAIMRMGVTIVNEDIEKRLEEIFRLITEDRIIDIPKDINPEKIPSTRGHEHYTTEAVNSRLNWVRAVSGAKLENIAKTVFKSDAMAGNIENYIGAVQVPLGIAGPILVKGTYVNNYVPVPIATSEGALVGSISRGARACNLSGGVRVHVLKQVMLRAPLFICEDMDGALNLERWILNHESEIRDRAGSISSAARVTNINTFVFGSSLHVQFYYTTGDAAGQNMTTACTWFACEWIVDQIVNDDSIKLIDFFIEGNMSGDKKINYQNFINGRGVAVSAECHIPDSILQTLMRTDAKTLIKGWQGAQVAASRIGMMGVNGNFANVLAGIFTATGQDIACVHESSLGILSMREEKDGVTLTAYLPSLVIGTVGGGTGLPAQRECLEIMGCAGNGKQFRLAEIMVATCLALDLSTLSAICAKEFAQAHEKLGRNRSGFSKSDINVNFFNEMIHGQSFNVIGFKQIELKNNSGILSKILNQKTKGINNLFRYSLDIIKDQQKLSFPALLKIKSIDKETINISAGITRFLGEDKLSGMLEAYQQVFGFGNSHIHEIEFYNSIDREVLDFTPEVYGMKLESERGFGAVLLEDLSDFPYFDTMINLDGWPEEAIKTVLEGLSSIHSRYFDDFDSIPGSIKAEKIDFKIRANAKEFLKELTFSNRDYFPEFIPEKTLEAYNNFLENIGESLEKAGSFPMTLTHNDLNTGNICVRKPEDGYKLCAYNWEMLCFQNPQHDLAEFLIFAFNRLPQKEVLEGYIDYYIECLEGKTGKTFDRENFYEVLKINVLELATVRFNLYLLAHRILRFEFMERVYKNLVDFINIIID